MQFHLLLIGHLTASFFTSTQSIPERSRAAGSKALEGQNGSKENFKNEIRTEKVVAGTHAKMHTNKQRMQREQRWAQTQFKESRHWESRASLAAEHTQPISKGSYDTAGPTSKCHANLGVRRKGKQWAESKCLGLPVPNKSMGTPVWDARFLSGYGMRSLSRLRAAASFLLMKTQLHHPTHRSFLLSDSGAQLATQRSLRGFSGFKSQD